MHQSTIVESLSQKFVLMILGIGVLFCACSIFPHEAHAGQDNLVATKNFPQSVQTNYLYGAATHTNTAKSLELSRLEKKLQELLKTYRSSTSSKQIKGTHSSSTKGVSASDDVVTVTFDSGTAKREADYIRFEIDFNVVVKKDIYYSWKGFAAQEVSDSKGNTDTGVLSGSFSSPGIRFGDDELLKLKKGKSGKFKITGVFSPSESETYTMRIPKFVYGLKVKDVSKYVDLSNFVTNTIKYEIPIDPKAKKPTLSLTATPSSVGIGGSAIISWETKNSKYCINNFLYKYSVSEATSFSTGPISKPTTYKVTCFGAGGAVTKTIEVLTTGQPQSATITSNLQVSSSGAVTISGTASGVGKVAVVYIYGGGGSVTRTSSVTGGVWSVTYDAGIPPGTYPIFVAVNENTGKRLLEDTLVVQ